MNQQEAVAAPLRYLPPFVRERVERRPQLLKILSNMSWLFFDHLLRVVLGLLIGAWVARYLGKEDFGLLNYATTFVALFGAFTTLGLTDIVIRDIVKEPSAKEEILGTAFWLRLLGSVFVVIMSVVIVSFLRPGDVLARWLVAIISVSTIFQSWLVIDLWFQSQVRSKYTVWSKSTAYVLANIFKVAAILLGAPVVYFAVALLLEVVLTAVGLAFNYRRRGHSFKAWRPSITRAKHLLSDSWPLALSSLMVLIYMRVDVIMLGEMSGDAAVGIYTSVSRLVDYSAFVPLVIASSLFPALVKSKEKGVKIYTERLQQFYDVNAAIAYGIILVAVPLAPMFILGLYGQGYAAATPIFVIYIWANLFSYIAIARSRQLLNDGLLKFSLVTSALGVIINVGINLLLIPQYEGVGAAIATVAAQVGAGYLSSLLLLRRSNAWTLQTKALLIPLRYLLLGLRYLGKH